MSTPMTPREKRMAWGLDTVLGMSVTTNSKGHLLPLPPKMWEIFATPNDKICVDTANAITKAVFNSTFSERMWKDNLQLKIGVFTREIAETLIVQAKEATEEMMIGCKCGSRCFFYMKQEK